MPSKFDLLTKVVIPLTTFILGALVTFLVQKYWRKRDVVNGSAKALADLTADWYNQLDELRKSLNQAIRPTNAAELVDSYVRNRLILPKVLYHVAVLRQYDAYPELVAEVEAFLSSVSSYNPWVGWYKGVATAPAVQCIDLLDGRPNDPEAVNGFLSTLSRLDEHQQAVVREAARTGR